MRFTDPKPARKPFPHPKFQIDCRVYPSLYYIVFLQYGWGIEFDYEENHRQKKPWMFRPAVASHRFLQSKAQPSQYASPVVCFASHEVVPTFFDNLGHIIGLAIK